MSASAREQAARAADVGPGERPEPRANLDPAAAELVEPLIGAGGNRTRVVTSHDPAGGLAEADLALGLRAGRAELLAPAADVTPPRIGALYG